MFELEVFVLVDENGEYVISSGQEDLHQIYLDDINSNGLSGLASRVISITLKVPTPTTVEVVVDVPEESAKPIVELSKTNRAPQE